MYKLITEASPKVDVRSWSSSSSGAVRLFPAFREEEDEDGEGSDVDDGDVTMAATYIDPTAKPIAAIKLLSDGSRKSSTYFVRRGEFIRSGPLRRWLALRNGVA